MNTIQLTWADFDADMAKLAALLRPILDDRADLKYTAVAGEPRGGLVVAVALAHRLNIGWVISGAEASHWTCGIWCDDIYDSGMTALRRRTELFRVRATLPLVQAVWVTKQPNDILAARVVPKDSWVIFPWELPERAETDRAEYLARSY